MAEARRGSSSRKGGFGRLLQPTNLLTSLLLVFPLFLFYQVGVLLFPMSGNGADLITARLIALLHDSERLYLLCNAGLALAFVVLVLALSRRQRFDLRLLAPVVLESGIYALTMGTLILQVMSLLGIDASLHVAAPSVSAAAASASQVAGGWMAKLVVAVGAGVHEELVFRLVLLSAAVGLLHRVLGIGRAASLVLGFLLTALLFSAAHHLVGGEPWRVGAFTYRFLCGLLFAALFQWRGFAIAVYTHALYDIYVLVFVGG